MFLRALAAAHEQDPAARAAGLTSELLEEFSLHWETLNNDQQLYRVS